MKKFRSIIILLLVLWSLLVSNFFLCMAEAASFTSRIGYLRLVKTDAEGYAQWSKQYKGSTLNTWVPSPLVETDDGGYAIAGSTASLGGDFWLMKTDSEGNVQWDRTYGGEKSDFAYSIVETVDGGYLLAGRTDSFGAGGRDSWLVKTDSQGNLQWNKTYGDTYYDYFVSAVQTRDGGYVAARLNSGPTWFSSMNIIKTDTFGNVEWNMKYPPTDGMMQMVPRSIIETDAGEYVFTGCQTTADDPHIARKYVWVVKIDPSTGWNRRYGSGVGYSVVQTDDGGYAIAGNAQPWFDARAGQGGFLFVKTNPVGDVQWEMNYGSGAAFDVIQTSDGGYILAGSGLFNLLKIDSAGNPQWNMTYNFEVRSFIQTSDGGYALTGYVILEFPSLTLILLIVFMVSLAVYIVALALALYKRRLQLSCKKKRNGNTFVKLVT